MSWLSQDTVEELVRDRCIESGYILMSNFEYIGNGKTTLNIKCPIHNYEWTVTYANFVSTKSGCIKCGYDRMTSMSKIPSDIVRKNINARCQELNISIINNFIYTNNESKIKLRCNIDNYEWESTYTSLVNNKHGCPKCARNVQITQSEAEIAVNERCNKMNFELLNEFKYTTKKSTRVSLRCLKCNKYWETSYDTFVGSSRGCPRYRRSFLELSISDMLNSNNIQFVEQYKPSWLEGKSIDFFIPNKNVAIECQGEQHFYPVRHFGGMINYKKVLKRDVDKFIGCQDNGIKLLYFTKETTKIPDTYFSKIYTKKQDILDWII